MGAAVAVAAVGMSSPGRWYVRASAGMPARLAAEWPGVYRARREQVLRRRALRPGLRPRRWPWAAAARSGRSDATVVDRDSATARARSRRLARLDRVLLRSVRRGRRRQRLADTLLAPRSACSARPERPRSELRADDGRSASSVCVGGRSCCSDEAHKEDAWTLPRSLLSIITYTPLVGALASSSSSRKEKAGAIKAVRDAVAARRLPRLPAAVVLASTGPATASSSSRRRSWIPSIGVQYLFGVDGISPLLILLTTLLGFIAILSLAGRRSPTGVRSTTSSCCCSRRA